MAVSWLGRLARAGPAQVYPIVGSGARDRARRLRLDDRIALAWSPRGASVLLVMGALPSPLSARAALVHDQIPHPRCVVVWSDDRDTRARFPVACDVAEAESPIPRIERQFRLLMEGRMSSSPALLAHENPVPWKGVGPFGQGGEGMIGGRPYGRRLAALGPELRDGLELDRLHLTVGPFLRWLPPGLELDVELQGDVIQRLTPRVPAAPIAADRPEPFERARREAVFVADLELARARHHLAASADLVLLHGLDALAHKLLRLADRARPGDGKRVRNLARALEHSGALRLATRGVGTIRSPLIEGTGPSARASARPDDARHRDPAYDGLGVVTGTRRHGDASARLFQRLAEAANALDVARRAGWRRREPGPPLEGVRGPEGERAVAARWPDLVAGEATGRAWDAFVTTLVSLDVDAADFPAHDGRGTGRAATPATDDPDRGAAERRGCPE